MNENENLVVEEATENVEVTTEETPKMFTQEEVNEIVGKAKATARAKGRKQGREEAEREYSNLVATLEAGTGKKGINELDEVFTDHYQKRGVKLPERRNPSDAEVKARAETEFSELMADGFEVVKAELDRLTEKGMKMTAEEKALYPHLVGHITAKRNRDALINLGATDEEINSKDYQDFSKQFNSDVPEETRYNLYRKTHKKEYKPMGSMKQSQDKGTKDYYTEEEISRLTEEDLKNPKVWDAVRRSMTGR